MKSSEDGFVSVAAVLLVMLLSFWGIALAKWLLTEKETGAYFLRGLSLQTVAEGGAEKGAAVLEADKELRELLRQSSTEKELGEETAAEVSCKIYGTYKNDEYVILAVASDGKESVGVLEYRVEEKGKLRLKRREY